MLYIYNSSIQHLYNFLYFINTLLHSILPTSLYNLLNDSHPKDVADSLIFAAIFFELIGILATIYIIFKCIKCCI